MKKKILFIMPSMFIGGAERSLLGLLNCIDYENYDVSLFLYRHEGEFMKYIPSSVQLLPAISEYATFDVPIKTLLSSQKIPFAIARLLSKIAMKIHCKRTCEKPGIWMAMQYTSKFLMGLLPDIPGTYDMGISFLGVPDVLVNKVEAKLKLAWNHTDYAILGPNQAYDRKIYKQIDYIVSVSEPCTEQFLKVYPEFIDKAITIENILSCSLLHWQAEEEITELEHENETIILSVGRYSYAKNFDNIPFLCKKIREAGFNVKWFIIGYGGEEELIKHRIKETEMEEFVVLLGKKENPYPYIKSCDVYVQPSRYEGKCVAVREAQILGKPVIITNYATASSQLTNGYDGVVVPMDNEGCAEGIIDVLRDRGLQHKLVENMKLNDYTNSCEIEKLYRLIG